MHFDGAYDPRSSIQANADCIAPGETEIQRINPQRERQILAATGWPALFPGSLNLSVEQGVLDELALLHVTLQESASEVVYPPKWAHIPRLREAYWYYAATARRAGREVPVLVRRFSGKVSHAAASDPSAVLRLEHHHRIQTKLTTLVAAHAKLKRPRPEEFVRTILDCESVHIVTFDENYAARRAEGDYRKAGIKLLSWRSISTDHRQVLWKKMLRGKVANANEFSVSPARA